MELRVKMFLMVALLMCCGIFTYYYYTNVDLQLALAQAEAMNTEEVLDIFDLIFLW